MKLIVLGMLLAIVQTAPPVPRHAADKTSSSSQGVENHPGNKKIPTPSPTPTQDIVKPEPQNNGADTPHAPNAQQPIVIGKLPAVSVNDVNVKKDWMDKTAWLFGGLLLLIGAAGVCAAVKTLKAINRQAELMEKQISIPYRARLTVGKPRLKDMEAEFPIENYGHVEGRIISVEIEIIIQSTIDGHEIHRCDMKKDRVEEVIVPGKDSPFTLTVRLPHAPQKGEDHLLSVKIKYDTGFKSTDTFHFVRVYRGDAAKWVTAWTSMEMDFLEPKPNKADT